MKTFDRKDIYSWANCEEAKKYIGKQGFIGASLGEISERLKKGGVVILQDVEDTGINCFYFEIGFFKDCSSGLFLPLDKVKEVEEKKWRAFKDLDEFANTLGLVHILGSEITYRTKAEDTKGNAIITRECTSGHMSYISLGSHSLSLENLFKYYEWLDKDGKWQPFGVEEKING